MLVVPNESQLCSYTASRNTSFAVANAFARLIHVQTRVLPESPQLGGGRSMGQFPTKQTQTVHLAVSKNKQIWEKLSNFFFSQSVG